MKDAHNSWKYRTGSQRHADANLMQTLPLHFTTVSVIMTMCPVLSRVFLKVQPPSIIHNFGTSQGRFVLRSNSCVISCASVQLNTEFGQTGSPYTVDGDERVEMDPTPDADENEARLPWAPRPNKVPVPRNGEGRVRPCLYRSRHNVVSLHQK